MSLTIIVKNTIGTRFEMEVPSLSETIAQFKTRLEIVSSIPAASQRLIFRGHILKDSQTFAEIKATHGLASGHSMHVVPSPTPRAAQPSATASPTPQNSAGEQPNPMGGGGMGRGGTGPGGWPDIMEMQQQMMRNPQQMQALMNSPIMENLLNNPEIARSLIMANPQMRELFERNPELAHVFNDPATLRQVMQMARNPSLSNEMMRNTDRQMANIEMMPGGFDALRRMHENIQAPLMDAAQGFGTGNGENAGTGTEDNPFTSLFQQNTPSNAPMPNPWAPAGTNTPSATAPGAPPTAMNGSATTAPSDGGANAFAQLFQGMNPASNNDPTATPPPMPGMEGAGFPTDASVDSMLQMLENPMMQQVLQHVLSDPQMFQSMVASHPQLQARIQSNPEMARLLQNPELMRSFLNPDVMRSIRQLQNAVAGRNPPGGVGQTPPAPTTTATGAATEPANTQNTAGNNPPTGTGANSENPMDGLAAMMNAMAGAQTGAPPTTPAAGRDPSTGTGPNTANFMENLTAMMNAMATANGGNSATPAPEMTQEQLEEMYSSQLQQLREMGFLDKTTCLQALQQSRGNVSAAIENLLSRFGG